MEMTTGRGDDGHDDDEAKPAGAAGGLGFLFRRATSKQSILSSQCF